MISQSYPVRGGLLLSLTAYGPWWFNNKAHIVRMYPLTEATEPILSPALMKEVEDTET